MISLRKYSWLVIFFIFIGQYSCKPSEEQLKLSGNDEFELAGIGPAMQKFIAKNEISGVVTFVARNSKVVHFDAVGDRDIASSSPMQKHTIFRIASMTKPFVAAAIMMQVESGKLSLDDPVEKYLPEFSGTWMVDQKSDSGMVLVRPSRKINIRDILRHTSGIPGIPTKTNVKSIREHTLVSSGLPLLFEPGSQWMYGGEGITAAARIVEVLSGMDYTEFLKEKIFIPLGMNNTYLSESDKISNRIATLYVPGEAGNLQARASRFHSSYFRPDAGLLSTASDMAIFLQTMLNGGTYNETRILSEESVREITKIQTSELECGFTEGMSFGLGFALVNTPTGVTSMLSHGTFGHGGAFGTNYWADPETGTIYILMIQRQGFGNGDDSDIRKEFQTIAASALK